MQLEHYLTLQKELRQARQACHCAEASNSETYRIYEAADAIRPQDTFLVSVSTTKEKGLQEDIMLGRKLLRLGRMIFETSDMLQARRLSDRHYL